MEKNRNIRITVRPVTDREGEYMAHFASEFLKAEAALTCKSLLFRRQA